MIITCYFWLKIKGVNPVALYDYQHLGFMQPVCAFTRTFMDIAEKLLREGKPPGEAVEQAQEEAMNITLNN